MAGGAAGVFDSASAFVPELTAEPGAGALGAGDVVDGDVAAGAIPSGEVALGELGTGELGVVVLGNVAPGNVASGDVVFVVPASPTGGVAEPLDFESKTVELDRLLSPNTDWL